MGSAISKRVLVARVTLKSPFIYFIYVINLIFKIFNFYIFYGLILIRLVRCLDCYKNWLDYNRYMEFSNSFLLIETGDCYATRIALQL